MKKLLLSVFFVAFFIQLGFSQSKQSWIDAADDAYEQGDFYAAYKYYGIALEYDDEPSLIWYQFAQSAREFDIYTRAEEAYQKVVSCEDANDYPLASYWLAKVKQRLGRYDDAIAFYQKFLDDFPNAEESIREDAVQNIENSTWAKTVIENKIDVDIRNMTDSINSPYADFGVALKGDTMYFSSFRYIYKKDSIIPARPFNKIAMVVNGQQSLVPSPINEDGHHFSNTAFSSDFSMVYYTKCDYISTTELRCQLYASQVSADGTWGPGEKLSINEDGYDFRQPNVALDMATGKEKLFFVSDKQGGRGLLDIWFCEILDNGTFGPVQNLTEINTEGNEITPFYMSQTHTLYFSSDYYQTLGGYDIYEARNINGQWATPTHLPAPVNSSFDDTYYSLYEGGEKAFFASKRPDSTAIFWDETRETCCSDIYTYKRKVGIDLLATTFNGLDNSDLFGVTVSLYEVLPNGDEILVDQRMDSLSNTYNFRLYPDKVYKLKATKNGYSEDLEMIDLTTPEMQGITSLKKDLFLEEGVILNAFTFDNIDSLPLIGTTVKLFGENAAGEVVLLKTLENPGGNDFSFQIKRGKRYILKADKAGFPSVIDKIDLRGDDFATTTKIKRNLYLGQELEALTLDLASRHALNEATVTLYELTPDGRKILKGKIYNGTGNDFLFPIDLSRKYEIKAERRGYETVVQPLAFDPSLVNSAQGKITVEIPMKRNSLEDFLPLTLYFDNDFPNPRSHKTTTTQSYIETNEAYYAKKDEFIKEFTAGLEKNEAFITTRTFQQFFDIEVNGAKRDLKKFSEELLKFLDGGYSFTIRLKGYASPRATAAYNERLSKRRIDCVKNYLEEYDHGKLVKYMKNGKLKIREEAYGESTAKEKGVSDKLEDKKNSVYSVIASIERRVEIVGADMGDK